eukprot:1154318-Pelagomonas_calceolata.AAC.2
MATQGLNIFQYWCMQCELARVALRGLHTKLLHLAHVRGGGGEGAGWDLAGLRAKDLASQLSACL